MSNSNVMLPLAGVPRLPFAGWPRHPGGWKDACNHTTGTTIIRHLRRRRTFTELLLANVLTKQSC
jgi:hypothetical protein